MGAISGRYARAVMAAAEPLVSALGGHCWLDTGSDHGHGRLMVKVGTKVRSTPMSSTPRNVDDAVKRKICDLKRMLREMT